MVLSPQELSMILAQRIKVLRLQRLWTREDLAKHADVNVYTLKRFERTGQISLERLLALSQALGVMQEFESILKLRQRVDINDWTVNSLKRQRGKRKEKMEALVE